MALTNNTTNLQAVLSAVNALPTVKQEQTKTATPSESQQTITPDTNKTLSSVTVNAIPSSYVGSGVARKTSSDLTASGATVTAPAGYYESAATKTISSGTTGTPSATKGTVSNYQVSVTPSVTNTTGYITGGTKTGTAVTVTADELIGGTTLNSEVNELGETSGNKTASQMATIVGSANDAIDNQTTLLAQVVTALQGKTGGGSSPTLQSKSVTYTSNGTATVTADSGYDGLSSVDVTVNVSGGGGETVTISYTSSSSYPMNAYANYLGTDGIHVGELITPGQNFTVIKNSLICVIPAKNNVSSVSSSNITSGTYTTIKKDTDTPYYSFGNGMYPWTGINDGGRILVFAETNLTLYLEKD